MENPRRRRAISSSLGNVDLGDNVQKVLTVDDPSVGSNEEEYEEETVHRSFGSDVDSFGRAPVNANNIREIENQINQARREQRNPRAPHNAVTRMELLTGIGRLTTSVTIEKVKFKLKSLKSKELRYVMEKAAKYSHSNVGEAMMIRNYTIAFSLFEIDDNPIETIIGTNDIEDKINIIDDFEESVIGALWKAYSSMVDESAKNVSRDLGHTPEQIVDNVKKS